MSAPIFLRAPTRQAFRTALAAAGMTMMGEDGIEHPAPRPGEILDEIGVIVVATLSQGLPGLPPVQQLTTLPGWHANLYHAPDCPVALQPYRIDPPAQPLRVLVAPP